MAAVGPFGGMIVVTDQRTIHFDKKKPRRQYRHGEVNSTKIYTQQNGRMLVQVISDTAALDYSPNDTERYNHIIQVSVGTPRAAQMICGAVDSRIPGGGG